jgi:hypothetical protein
MAEKRIVKLNQIIKEKEIIEFDTLKREIQNNNITKKQWEKVKTYLCKENTNQTSDRLQEWLEDQKPRQSLYKNDENKIGGKEMTSNTIYARAEKTNNIWIDNAAVISLGDKIIKEETINWKRQPQPALRRLLQDKIKLKKRNR